jgi:hypothetical protein
MQRLSVIYRHQDGNLSCFSHTKQFRLHYIHTFFPDGAAVAKAATGKIESFRP